MLATAIALALLSSAAEAGQSDLLTMKASGSSEEASQYFSRICLTAPGDLAKTRAAIKAEAREMTPAKSEVETYIAWPVQASLLEAEGFVQCFIASPVPVSATMAQALAVVRPLVAGGDGLATQETLTGDYATWRRVVDGRPQEVRLNLAATPGGKTIILSLSAKKAN